MEDDTLVQGRYRLQRRIGRGGAGEVWQAEDEALGRLVAVKCLVPEGRDDKELMRERFRREARLAAGLQHPGITVVHDFGEWSGVLFLVMELLHGEDLGRLLDAARGRRLRPSEAIAIGRQIAEALAYTHERGVIHRDLKPGNLIRTVEGAVKICDFGIARLGSDQNFTARLGGNTFAVGTPYYMSPEQIEGTGLDERADLYSFGCVLYELLLGHPPFFKGDPLVVLLDHRDTPPPPPRAERPEIPEALERLVLDLLAKDPEDRPASAREVLRRLDESAQAAPPPRGALPTWARGIGPVPVSLRRIPAEPPALTALTRRWTA
ncbi:serine/threonine-protein kinase [Streptacidiphilus jiangxiensis]|uniref:non-specific serine/threonine protein kinase n=1 Tax=Streptacidiphilus jiangxiensis TaxID=235985 RepID=A0A1H7UA62_STRJI|nr:Serine/threonine protein kinase [Streptacidiphilus jiangxiensis]